MEEQSGQNGRDAFGRFIPGHKHAVGHGRPRGTFKESACDFYPSDSEVREQLAIPPERLRADFRKALRGEFAACKRMYMFFYIHTWHVKRLKALRAEQDVVK